MPNEEEKHQHKVGLVARWRR